ncbi:MAG: protein phosphatase 2C domain-containing protein [Faecalibacterium prausnitzii]
MSACDVIEHSFHEQYAQCLPGDEEKFLKRALINANRFVFQKASREEELAGMGTTAVCALVRGGSAFICHAGDSRAYLVRGGRLTQLTHDHSYVQELVDCGTITAEEAEHHPQKNIITRALGVDSPPRPRVHQPAGAEGRYAPALHRRPHQRPAQGKNRGNFHQGRVLRHPRPAGGRRQRGRRPRQHHRAAAGRGAAGGEAWIISSARRWTGSTPFGSSSAQAAWPTSTRPWSLPPAGLCRKARWWPSRCCVRS